MVLHRMLARQEGRRREEERKPCHLSPCTLLPGRVHRDLHSLTLRPLRIDHLAGAGMGLALGVFLGAMGDMQPLRMIKGREVPQAPLREQV